MTGSPASAQVAGQNVNMVSGTGWTNGDPFLERQNEPSIAVSTRNSAHLFGAANDYRSVDLPGLLGIDERGDAWLGVYKSFDGGLTWQSTLLPGYPLDASPEGAASPIHGRQAAADPLVRAGSNGLFFLTGIAFDRGSSPLSKVFISRFIDLNNKENGDATNENGAQTNLAPRDPVKYIDTHVIDSGSSNRFLDKPWVAVDIPRGQATCTIKANQDGNVVTQKIPAGAIYVTYTAFTTVGNVQNSQILFRRSTDCGATWSKSLTLSQSDERAGQPDVEGQGTVIAIDPTVSPNYPATIYVAWRVFANPGDPEEPSRIRIAKSTDGGLSFTQQQTVVQFPLSCNTKPTGAGCPFDQGETGTSFRSNGYPALTVDSAGRIYMAWSQRDSNGDGRIMMTVSNEWDSWPTTNFKQIDPGPVPDDYGNPFTNLSNRGSQLMPALSFNAGKLLLTYYDLRQDHTSGSLTPAPEPACDPAITPLCPLGNPFSEIRQYEDELLTNPGAVFNAYVDDATLTSRRHTIDIMGAEAVPASTSGSLVLPSFTHFRVSRYEYGIIPPGANVQQAQFNAPNLPMFVQGTAPFMGDYIDVAGAPSMVPVGDSDWRFNTKPAANPVFHAVWTDNRDVLPPPDGISWNKYTPPISSSIGATSKFDPTQTPPACVPGYSGMRNQNIYTSRISHGLILTSPQTAKPVLQSNGKPIQRQFVVIMRNDTNLSHTFQMTIPAQPASAQASFLQFGLQNTLTVNIPALSSASRPVFLTPNAGSKVSFPSFEVDAVETDGGQPPLTASILFNADPTNPFLANPDNASFGSGSITSQEFYNPAILNPAILNPAILNPAILNPAILNPAILNPAILNPAILNPAILNPNFVVALNPAILNPAILNPAILNNAVANPAILNPAILNTPVSDASYTITNEGNTSATYQLQLFQSGGLPASAVFQIILTKTYLTPGVSPTDGCTYGGQVNNEVIASIDNPNFVSNPAQLGNPAILNSAINNPTFSMAPGDTVQVTLRANLTVSDLVNFVLPNLSPVVAAQAVNTVAVQQGITTPPISLLITTSTLPFAVTGQPYSAPLAALGGNPPLSADTWSLIGGSLPPGLNLSSAGVISGTATATGAFPFVVQVTDTGTPQHTATRSLTINVFAPVVIQTAPLPNAAVGFPYTQFLAAIGGLGPYSWTNAGPLPPGLALSSSGTISGIPTTPGTYTFSVTATDTLGLSATASLTILVSNSLPVPAQVAFVVQPSNAVGSQSISPAVQVQVFDATGAVIPGVQVAMNFGNPACSTATLSGSPLATTNANGIASFSNLIIDRGQLGYTLLATAGNATAVSSPFTVNGFCPTKGPIGIPRQNHTAVTLANGTVLIAGGGSRLAGVSSPGLPFSSAELYDPATGNFSATGNLNVPRWGHTAALLLDGRVLVTGGVNSSSSAAGTVTNTAEIYDPSTQTFTPTAGVMNSARFLHTATRLADGRVLIVGGATSVQPACILCFGSSITNTAEIFDPATGLFTPTSTAMATARQLFTATLLPNGQVLIAGGFSLSASLSSAEIFDPLSGGFHSTSNLTVPRVLHVAVLLPSGKVLLAGPDQTAELYDPVSGTFAPTGNLTIAVAGHSATLLADGTVILPGGLPPGPPTVATSSDQIYTPGTGTFALTGSLVTPTSLYALALLQDGTVLITGGEGGINGAGTLADSEIYYSSAPLAPLAITTTAVANATEAAPYTQLLLERGGVGTLTWTLASGALPPGITLSASGILAGTPTAPGTFNFTVQVVDSSKLQKTATSGTLTVIVAGVPLQFISSSMPTAGSGRFYSQPLPIVGGTPPYAVTQTGGTLPPGLSLSSNGVLAGTPSAAGVFTFTVNALDSSVPQQTATQTLTIAINSLFITTTVLPNGIVGVPYNAPIATAGGTLPLSFSLATAAFPPGLLIQQPGPGSQTGALAGTPTTAGTFVFSESVIDSSAPTQTATQNYVVTIAPSGTAAPAIVSFVSDPQTSVGGQTLAGSPIIVSVADASNKPIAGASVALSLGGIFNGPVPCSTAVLSGNLSGVTGASGQVTFSNLSIDRGGFNYVLVANAGSASGVSTPFHVQGFCPSGNLSTQREFHTQVQLGTAQSIVKFPLDPKGTYLLTNTNPAPPGIPDLPNPPLIISLASLGLAPGSVISGVAVGDMNACGVGQFCSGEFFNTFVCGVFSSSNTLLPSGGTINRVPGAIAPNFNTAIPCVTNPTNFGGLATDIPQDFAFFGEQVTVPPGAVYLFVALPDSLYADNTDPNGDFGLQLTINSPSTNGKVLIAGGADNLGNALNTAELYDPASGTTVPTGNLSDPNGRAGHISVLLPNGKVLLAGGVDNISFLNTAELYDPATGTFSPTGSMMHPRYLAEAALLADGRVLVAGGNDINAGIDTAEIYDPATGLWTPAGNMTQRRIRHNMTLLPNGKVLVTGGRDAAVNFFGLASAELFDPFANQGVGAFIPIGNMHSVRFVHTASLLPNGTVLIAGGFDNTFQSVTSAEVFDPSTNTFTLTGALTTPRSRYTATLLPDGTVLEVGGTNSIQGVTAPAPAEIYSAGTGSFAQTGPTTTGRELHRASPLFNGNVLVSGGDDGVNVLATTELYFNPVVKEPIVITTTSIPNAFVGQPYVAMALEVNSAGPVKWTIISGGLPPGIKGNTIGTYGVAYGTPTTAGSFTFTTQVTDGISTATTSFTINVSVATLAFTSSTMPQGGLGKPYSQPLPVTGGTPPYTAAQTGGTLPPGLALSSTGVLSGTPSSAGSFTFTVNVTDSSTPTQSATQTLTMAVNSLFITTTALPNGIVGVPYGAAISTTGGTLPLSFSSANAAFPPGLTIQQPAANSHGGALSGTPTLAGHYTFTESVVDSSNPVQTATQYYTMDVLAAGNPAPANLTFLSQPQNSVGGQILTGSPVRVHVTDANNAPILGASVAISFNGAPCSTAVLSGTLVAITNNAGNAVFPDLSIDRGQLGYILLASAGSASAVSQPFTVNGFCPTSNLSFARRYPTSTLLFNGKVLVTGGDPDTVSSGSTSSELFDPVSGSFTPSGTMNSARAGHKATLLSSGQVLVTGGRGPSNGVATAELYNPANALFTSTGSMNTARLEHTSTLLADGRVLIAGGFSGLLGSTAVYSNGTDLYDPVTGTFTASGILSVARAFHTATLLPNGKVLIAGGSNSSGPLASVEIYDPVTGTSTPAGTMSTPRNLHTATLLPNGRVLLAGGQTSTTGLASAELFDPATGTFALTGSMLSASAESRDITLPDGTVLISGGFTFPSTIAEIYDPASGTFSTSGSLVNARIGNGATLLANGQVLLAGGANPQNSGTSILLNSAEIYYSTAPFGPMQVTTPNTPPAGQPGTTVLTNPTAFNGLVSGTSIIGFNGILAAGARFQSFNPLTVSGISFSTPLSGTSVDVTASTFYSPSVYPSDFIISSVNAATGAANPNNQLVITLSQPARAFAMDFGGLGFNGASSGSITLSNGFTLPLTSLPTVGHTQFVGFVSSVPFTSITFNTVNDAWVVLDVLLANANTNLPSGAVGKFYTEMLLEQGGVGNLTWILASGALPPGITLTPGGILIGTPTSGGTFTFAVHLVDSSNPQKSTTSGNFTLTISATVTPLVFAPQTLPTAFTSSAYTPSLVASGGTTPYNFAVSSGSLPPGIHLGTNGTFSGTPTSLGTFSFGVTATDSSVPPQTATQSFTIQVAAPLAITTSTLPGGTVNTLYNANISSTGGVVPVVFTVTAGTLPPGLLLTLAPAPPQTATLSGTPTTAGTFTFTVTATDTSTPPATASQSYSVTIAPAVIGPPAAINFVTQPTNTTAGQPISPAVQVQVLDGSGNAVPGVTVTLGAGAGQNRPILSGTLSVVTDASGVSTFSNVILDRGGTGFILLASVSGVSSSGAVQLISAPASVQQGATESDAQIQMFSENRGVTLSASVAADITAPGTYASTAGLTSGSIASGTKVDSYYLHSDPIGISQNVTQLQAGEVTFPTDVLGVEVLGAELTASDTTLGLSSVSYPASGRALALGSPTDTAILSADRRTVTLHLSGMNATKDARVITAANPNSAFGSVSSAAFNSVAAPGSISTVAGSTWVFPGAGPATAAPLGLGADFIGARMSSVADASGNLYIADPNNQMVFKLSGGTLSIVAGTGVEGYSGDGGLATQARLDFPSAVALSSSGELYIADENNSVIRKVSTSGIITTVAGNGVFGYSGDGGPATSASLSTPEGINFDAAGSLLIADSSNGVIRKLDTAGNISTVPVTTLPGLLIPEDVVVGPAGVLFIADSNSQQVLRLDSGGNLTPVAGINGTPGYSGDGGPATGALLNDPTAITFDGSGNLYIADEGNSVVRKVDTAGTITTIAGQGSQGFAGDGGPAALALLAQPGGLSFDSAGNLFISDTTNERIRKVDLTGTIATVAGNGRFKYAGDSGLATSANLNSPIGVTVDPNGNIFAADVANFVVRRINPQGVISTYAGTGVVGSYTGDGGSATSAIIDFPIDVQADNASDIFFSEGSRIHKIGPSGIISSLLSGLSNINPNGGGLHFAVDRGGNIYFDSSSAQVSKLDTTGAVSLVAGTGLHGFSGDGGPATSAALRLVRGLAVDSAGNLYIADQTNHRVRRVDTNGTITTVAGNGSATISGDGGPATSAGVPNPFALSVDGAGNLFIGSAGRVRKVNASGTITTIAGGGFIGAAVDGIAPTSTAFTAIQGLAFDGSGNLYVTDRFNDRIRKITGVTTTPPFIFNPPSGLTIATNGLPHGNVGTSYFQTLSAVGGTSPYAWSVLSGSLPGGLNLSSTGQISGTPTAGGAFTFVAQVTDSLGAMATQSLTITINTPLALAPQTLLTGITGRTYSTSLAGASRGTPPYSFAVTGGALPPGITLASNGTFSGAPTTTGSFSFTVTATDSSVPLQTAQQAFTIPVVAPLGFVAVTPPNGTVGVAYPATTISVSGGTPPVGFGVTSGTFPPGLTLLSSGPQSASLGGTPTTAGTFTFTVTATDSSLPAMQISQGYTVTIAPAVAPIANAIFVTPLQNSIEGQVLAGSPVQVLVTDTIGTPIPNASVTMTFNSTPPCPAATLGGTLTQTTDATGTATFANLTIDRGQFGYTLAALAGSISGVSNPFNVEGFCDTGSLDTPRRFRTGTLLSSGKVLVAGGEDSSNAVLASALLYDPGTGIFTSTGTMATPRWFHSATLLPNGKVLIAGGITTGSTDLNSAELFDPTTGVFTPTGSMNVARAGHTATQLLNGKVLVAGGGTNGALAIASAELYDPATGVFTLTGNMSAAREQQTATLLADGTVLFVGGADNSGNPQSTAEFYDPSLGAFTLTGSMSIPRQNHAAVLLPNGTVLVLGGLTATQPSFVQTAIAEIYDPVLLTFNPTGSLVFAQGGPAATALTDGSVLATNGTDAEVYSPAAGAFRLSGRSSVSHTQQPTILLNDGTVLVAGGNSSSPKGEIFYPQFIPGITITVTLLPNATQNQPYTQLLLEQGGVGTLTWALTANSGPLPTGVTLSSNGILSGTPTQFGGFVFTVQVTDSSVPPKTATITYALLVNPIFQFFGTQLVTALSGVAYNNSLPLIGGTPPYATTQIAGTLPAGLNLANSAISGTTTALGTYTLSFQATDSSVPPQSTTGTLTLGVTTPLTITTTTLPNGALNSSYSATIATSGGLGNIILGPTANTLPPGLTMSPQGAISGTPTQTGTFNFTVLAVDQSFPPQTPTQAESITIGTVVAPISLSPNPLNLLANNSGNMTATLSAAAGPNGQTVNLASSNPSVASVPSSVNVLPNTTSATFQVTAGATANTATITASAPGSTSGNASVIVTTRPMILTTDGPLLAVNRSFNATVTLAQPVPASSSVTVALSANPSGLVSISPPTQTILAGQSTAVFTLTAGASAGGTLLTATASGYTNATAPLTVTSAVISLQGVTVAPGQSNSLPVSLSQPAPIGGVTITLTSNAPGTATVTPTVFVPAGAQTPSANPQVTGVLIGSASVTATAIGFAPDTAAVNVTVTATFSPGTLSVISNGGVATATLNISAPAPTGGITFNLATGATGTATVPAQATVIQGATSVQFQVTGVAAGSTTLTANSTGITQATATINVTQAPQISIGSLSIGQNLEVPMNVFLGAAAPAGGVTVTIASSDPTKILLSTTGTDAGSGSLPINVAAGNSFVATIYVYALQASGSVAVTANAPGYATGTGTMTMLPSGFIINSPGAITTTTFSGPTSVQVTPSILTPGTLTWAGNQNLRGGIGPFSIPVSLVSSAVGTLTPTTLTFNGGDSFQLASFQPSTAGGSTTLNLGTQPPGFNTPANFLQIPVSVNPPVISFPNLSIGNNLQSLANLFLAVAPPSPVTVTLTTNSTNLLLSKTGTDAGSGTLTFTNVTSSFVGTVFVYALQSTGTSFINISAPGYATANPTITMQPSGFIINTPGAITTTTFSGPTSVQVTPSILTPGTLNWAGNQSLRGGIGPFIIPVSLVSTAVGTLTPATLTFNGGDSSQLTSFQPSTAGGSTTLNLGAQPAGFSTPANFQLISVSVTSPIISFPNLTIGNNLTGIGNLFLGATPPSPLTVTLTTNSANLLLSKTGTDAGSGTLTFTNVTSTFVGTVFVYALQSTGTAPITISAPGYATGTATITMQPSGFIINTPGSISTTTFSGPTSVQVTPAILSPGTLNWAGNQSLRGGIGPFSLLVSLGSGSVGTLTPGTLTFNGGDSFQLASFQPSSAGSTTLSLGPQPVGFSTPANFQLISVSVTAPAISVPSSANVGLNLQVSLNVFLQNAPPNPVTVTVTSPNAAIAAVTSDPTVVGGATATFPNVTSTFVGTLTIQGFSLNSTQIKLQAAGYTDAFISVTVDPSGFIINTPGNFATTVGSATSLQITPAVLAPPTLNWNGNQTLRAGMTVSLNVTSSNTAVGTISASPLTFPGNATFVTTSFQAVAPGSSTITVVPPAGFGTPSNFQQITATVQ